MLSTPLLAFFFSGPFSVLATAAGAVSVPIIIHLLNRKRFRIVPWAAMRFLLAAQKKNSRRLRLEQLILLAVRALIVLLLILAMASVTDWAEDLWRAHLPGGGGGGGPGGRRTHRILVIDGSLSMGLRAPAGGKPGGEDAARAGEGDSTCFEKARALAARIVQESVRGDGFSVVLMASSPRRIVGGGPAGPAEVARKVLAEIENLRLPHGNSDLAGTLETVFDLLKRSPPKYSEKEVYFLTDLQKTSWVLSQPGQVADALQGIQARAGTILLDVGVDKPPDNLAVTHLTLDPDRLVATTSGQTVFSAVIHNYGAATAGEVRARLHVGRLSGDKTRASDKIDMQDGQSQAARLARGENKVSFKHHFTSPGDYVVQVRLEGDALDLDDSRSVIVSVREQVPVLLVDGKTAADPFDGATEYLFDALNPFQELQPGAGLKRGPNSVIVRPRPGAPVRPRQILATDLGVEDPERGDLSKEDCVFLCDVPRLSPNEVKRLEAHVLRGGGLVIRLGPNVDLASYNDLLYRNGQGLLPARLLARQRAPRGHYFHFSADEAAFRQPPLAAFAQERFRVRLLSAPFSEFVRTEVPSAPAGGLAPLKLLTFLAAAEKPDQPKSSDPALYLREAAVLDWQPALPQLSPKGAGDQGPRLPPSNRGRVVLFTSTVNTDWTDWPRQGTFVWLMQELLGHAASGLLRERSLTVGDTLEEYLPGSAGADDKEVTLRTPDGRKEHLRTTSRNDIVVWRCGDSDVSGVYQATIGNNPRVRAFAVNFPAATPDMQSSESNLARTSKEELSKTYPEWEIQVVRDLGEAVHDGRPLVAGDGKGGLNLPQQGSNIARWLLLIALALLAAEVVLAWYFGHYSAVHERDRAPHGWARGKYAGYLRAGLGVAMGLLLVFALAAAVTLVHAVWTGDFLGFLPDSWRSAFEEARKIPSPAEGEGRRWGLDLGETRFPDPWLIGLVAVVLGVGVWYIYRREGRVAGAAAENTRPNRNGGRIALMLALRMGMFLLMLAILLPQLRVWFERQSWPDVVILIDDSASMSQVDDFRDPRVKAVADQLAQQAGLKTKERLRLAQALLARSDGAWLTELLARRQVKVHVYHCSARAARLASVSKPEEVAEAREAVLDLEAKKEHDSSQLGAAVRQVLNDFRGSSLAAIIMLTDGVTTEGEDLAQVSKYASQLKVPLFFVGIGDSQESRDVIVHDLEVADSVFVNDNLIFRPSVTVKGYGDKPGPVTLRLREKGRPQVLATQVVTPEAAGKPTRGRLEYRPAKSGIKTFVIDTDIRPDEVDKDNNHVESPPVFISEVTLIRVLYVEGYGRWEFRYVKTLLERESERAKNKKLIDLSVYLADADEDFWEEDRSAKKLKGRLPTRDELERFHVIILGDVDPRPRGNPQAMTQFLTDLAYVVRDKGRGLLMIAGERFAPHAYKDSPLRDVLPIDVTSDRPPEEPADGRTESYKPELTPLGRMHPMFSFNEKDPDPVWKKLREFYWYAEGYQPKRAAEVLAVHPTVRSLPGGGSKEGKHPLVVQQFVGAGRSLFFGFHETWRWRWREDELRFNQFWMHTIRYLAHSRQGRVELRLDKQKYLRGEPMKITVRFPEDAPAPARKTDVRVVVLNKDARERRTVKLAEAEDRRGTFEGTLTRTPVGRYELSLAQPRVPDPQPRAECRVLAPPGELEQVRMNQAEMESAARETRGRFYTLADADQLLDDLPSGTRMTSPAPGKPWLLWNHALLLVVALLFLSAEWIMRKRYHLL